MTQNTTCSVCYNTVQQLITCIQCEYQTCKTCTERYLLDSNNEPHCMQCNVQWSRTFLRDNFTNKFVNSALKEHREKILFDREKSMLPATQIYVERFKKADGLKNDINKITEIINDLYYQRDTLRNKQLRLYNGEDVTDDEEEVYEDDSGNITNNNTITTRNNSSHHIIRPCPIDTCLGFLSTRWKCGVCDINVCPECHEPKNNDIHGEHICNPDNIATAKLLHKETKPCPKCGALCVKVDGCDQVFAMCCGTTFSWKTGKIDHGVIHAPDYYSWLQRNGKEIQRNPLDIPCGGIPYITEIVEAMKHVIPPIDKATLDIIYSRIRILHHIQQIEMPFYQVEQVPIEEYNRKHRVSYMMGRLSEKKFKLIIQQADKAMSKKKDISMVLNTIVTIGSDISRRLLEIKKHDELTSILIEFDTLRDYMHEIMIDISRTYNCVTPRIVSTWGYVDKVR